MKATLNRVKGRNGYCGPAVISAITGCSTDDAARSIRENTGRGRITGVTDCELAITMAEFGFRVTEIIGHEKYRSMVMRMAKSPFINTDANPIFGRGLTLGKFAAMAQQGAYLKGIWAIVVGNHWVVMADGMIADNGTMFSRKPMPMHGGRKPKSVIKVAYRYEAE